MAETPDHLFLQCSFSKVVWALIPYVHLVLQDANSGFEIDACLSKWISANNDMTMMCQILTTAWTIWRDRCFKIFQGKVLNVVSTITYALELAEDTIQSRTSGMRPPTAQASITHQTYMNLPVNCMMLYCDASYRKNFTDIGICIYLIDGTVNYRGCKTVAGIARDPEEAECCAILEAAKRARSLDLDKICIYTDAKNLVSYLRNKANQVSWFSSSILDDSLFILDNFSFHEVRHTSRNSVSDYVAKHCRRFRSSK
ncbi:uncharacterized protein LOC113338916 [Papaver somniferum]|uniref:uncharacterized protein LOC113338916 n=1 Tax=Papaver somniferum TaxID=3469 RepID=UPI000E6FC876|nr:uncharacterized protein LOC113338916 [Papaver somniferum]